MVIAYLRVSTARQNLENQHSEITRYAESHGIEIDRWITDTVSGKTDRKNRNLGKILKRLKRGDTLIITEISRLSRSLHEIMTIMKYCVDNSVAIYSTKDGYTFDDSINSKVLSFAFGLAAEIEHKLISQRTKEAFALMKKQGKPIGRKKGSGEKIKILYDKRSQIIDKLKSGKNITQICKELDVTCRTFYRFRKTNPDIEEYIVNNLKSKRPKIID